MFFQELSEATLGAFNKQKFSAFYQILVLQRLKSFIYRFSHSPFGRLARTEEYILKQINLYCSFKS